MDQFVTEEDMVYLVDHFVLTGPKWDRLEQVKRRPRTWRRLCECYPGVSEKIVKAYEKLYPNPFNPYSFKDWLNYFVLSFKATWRILNSL